MMISKALFAAILVAVSTAALAQDMPGTPEEKAACRPDTRKFCIHIKPADGTFAYLGCLQANRQKLSRACRQVLESHGQ
jgi:hypothetical protein